MSVGIQRSHALPGLRTSARPARQLDISLKGFSASIVSAMDTVLDWQDRARQRHNLLAMDDHLLRDIGCPRRPGK